MPLTPVATNPTASLVRPARPAATLSGGGQASLHPSAQRTYVTACRLAVECAFLGCGVDVPELDGEGRQRGQDIPVHREGNSAGCQLLTQRVDVMGPRIGKPSTTRAALSNFSTACCEWKPTGSSEISGSAANLRRTASSCRAFARNTRAASMAVKEYPPLRHGLMEDAPRDRRPTRDFRLTGHQHVRREAKPAQSPP